MNDNHANLLAFTVDITHAHVSHNLVPVEEIPALIASVYGALAALGQPDKPVGPEYVPAVDPRKSVKPDHLISLIDGKPYKMLKRHLGIHGLTPEQYRQRYNLAPDYPMVARNYAEVRRSLAKSIGLGRDPNQRRGRRKAA